MSDDIDVPPLFPAVGRKKVIADFDGSISSGSTSCLLRVLKENMVRQAFTLRCTPTREDLNSLTPFRDRGHPQQGA